MRRILLWGVLVAVLLAVAVWALRSRLTGPDLPILGQVTPFSLTDHRGETITLDDLAGAPWIADFIFTRCGLSCPLMTTRMAELDDERVAPEVRLVSISVDPENDTPHVMKEYLKRYRAKPGWDFLTGSRADIDTVMTAFDAYIPDKMSHFPLNMIREPKTGRWIRLFGIMSSRDFLAEYKKVADQ